MTDLIYKKLLLAAIISGMAMAQAGCDSSDNSASSDASSPEDKVNTGGTVVDNA